MDQKKIGSFLKELRKEKGLTQEQLAELMYVSDRTVSRWETGSNLPSLDILIRISDYYNVELSEILDGERKSGKMNKELEETVLKVADYSNDEKMKMMKKLHIFSWIGIKFCSLHPAPCRSVVRKIRIITGFLKLFIIRPVSYLTVRFTRKVV